MSWSELRLLAIASAAFDQRPWAVVMQLGPPQTTAMQAPFRRRRIGTRMKESPTPLGQYWQVSYLESGQNETT
jgi:hypothetical protein